MPREEKQKEDKRGKKKEEERPAAAAAAETLWEQQWEIQVQVQSISVENVQIKL